MSIGIDQDRIRWPGSGSAVSGSTPYGFYDTDTTFQLDCYNSAIWAGRRLGYPVVDIEMVDTTFYACFEEAVNEYGSQVNMFNIKNNLLSVAGQTTNQNLTGKLITPNSLPFVIEISKMYGTEVGVGGYVEQKRGQINLHTNTQSYDLQALWGDTVESGSRLEIRRIFHGPPPAIARIYDPYSMTGMSYSNIFQEMGFGGYSPATQFLMTPIFEDLLRVQAIEFNDMVRKSSYSFELVNNKLKVFPVPTYDRTIYFEYYVQKDKFSASSQSGSYASGSVISDFANIPYQSIQYNTINAPGKQWIRLYYLALCKEVLGITRGKYSVLPGSSVEISLDGDTLRSEATAEKERLIEQLREMLESTTTEAQLESQVKKDESINQTLSNVPTYIYVF